MNTAESITARRWFICPTWAGVVPLLADVIANPHAHEESGDAARAELLRLAQALDEWNRRAPRLRALLASVACNIEYGNTADARIELTEARSLLADFQPNEEAAA
jgi:hypothetical protein